MQFGSIADFIAPQGAASPYSVSYLPLLIWGCYSGFPIGLRKQMLSGCDLDRLWSWTYARN